MQATLSICSRQYWYWAFFGYLYFCRNTVFFFFLPMLSKGVLISAGLTFLFHYYLPTYNARCLLMVTSSDFCITVYLLFKRLMQTVLKQINTFLIRLQQALVAAFSYNSVNDPPWSYKLCGFILDQS